MSPDRVTTVLDLAAIVLLAAGIGLALWMVWPPAGLVCAALVLIAASWFIDRRIDSVTAGKEGDDS